MARIFQKASLAVVICAFLYRAFGRAFGIYPLGKPGENVERRARAHLKRLQGDEKSLLWQIALDNMRFESDLLFEEEALRQDCLALQLKILDLSDRYEVAARLIQDYLLKSPVSRLLHAIISEAIKSGATRIQIDCTPSGKPLWVLHLCQGQWSESMQIPANLDAPLRGAIARAEAFGWSKYAHLASLSPVAAAVRSDWVSPQVVELAMEQRD
ncbi:MAG: hypothetical protein ACOYON_10835 [Fimbriimonas sp.]